MDMSLSKLQEIGKDREAWCTAVHEITKSLHDLATEQQQQLVDLKWDGKDLQQRNINTLHVDTVI